MQAPQSPIPPDTGQLGYDPARNQREAWVDQLPVPPPGQPEDYDRPADEP